MLRNSEIDDHERGFVASDELNPAKSRRVQLQLALTQTADRVFIQKVFQQYRGESA